MTLRIVAWTNTWNRAAANHGDYGSLMHLTEGGISGKTLCGRTYPASKGHPFSPKLCKRCRAKVQSVDLKSLVWVPSRED